MDGDRALLIACLDLTSLGDEDQATIEALCHRAVRAVPADPGLHAAAVCVWPRWVPAAQRMLDGSPVRIACATGGFPIPAAPLGDRVAEIEAAVRAGADEVDVPIARSLLGEPNALARDLAATREAAGEATWKAIVETGAVGDAAVPVLAAAAIEAGADFVKSSTGKGVPGVTPGTAGLLAEAVRDAGRPVGLKLSGGIRGVSQAMNHLAQVRAILGPRWPDPSTFRIGASALLDALVA